MKGTVRFSIKQWHLATVTHSQESILSKQSSKQTKMDFRMIVFQVIVLLQFCCETLSQFMAPGGGMMAMPQMMQPQMMQPGMQAMPMPMPGMPMGMPQSKIPVVVMPYYSKQQDKVENGKQKKKGSGSGKKNRKRKRIVKKKKHKSSGSDSASDSGSSNSATSSEEKYYRTKSKRKSKGKKKREILTPVVSYVTKNGRVVYQTKVKNENVKDWLMRDKRRRGDETEDSM